MKIQVTTNNVIIEEKNILNENEYNVHECEFEFVEEYNGLVKKAVFTGIDGKTYVQTIIDDKCSIPSEILTKRQNVKIGVYGYDVDNEELILRYSPRPTQFTINEGSYKEGENSTPPTPSEIEQLQAQITENANDIDGIIGDIVDINSDIVDIKAEQTEQNTKIQNNTDNISTINEQIITINADIDNLEETKADKSEIPTKTSQLTNDSGFINKNVNDLTNYTLKTNTGSLIDLEINGTTYVITLSLKDVDGNVISTDTIDLPLESVVVGGSYDAVNKKIVLTLENGNTVDIPVGDLIAGLQTEITSSNKLASDLVDDNNSGNKFVTTSEKSTWNAKYDKPVGGIPKTDLASDVQTSLGKADTALQQHQDISGKEDKSNKVTSISSSSTDTEYPTAKCVYDKLAEKQTEIDNLETDVEEKQTEINSLETDLEDLRRASYKVPGAGTDITLQNTASARFIDIELKGKTSQATLTGKNLFNEEQFLEASNWIKTDDVYSGGLDQWYQKFKNGFNLPVFEENREYAISFKGYTTGGTPRIVIVYSDNSTSTITFSATTITQYTKISTEGKTISNIKADYGSGLGNTIYLTEFQIEKNAEVTSFEPYCRRNTCPKFRL